MARRQSYTERQTEIVRKARQQRDAEKAAKGQPLNGGARAGARSATSKNGLKGPIKVHSRDRSRGGTFGSNGLKGPISVTPRDRSRGGYAPGYSPGYQAGENPDVRLNPDRYKGNAVGSMLPNDMGSDASPAWFNKSLEDYLAQAMGMMPGTAGMFDSEKNALRKNSSEQSARLQALYGVMNENMAASGEALAGQSAGIQGQLTNATQQATDIIDQSAAGAQATNEQVMREQGLQGAEGLLANNRSGADTVRSLSDITARGQEAAERENLRLSGAQTTSQNNIAGLASENMRYEQANSAGLLESLARLDSQQRQADNDARMQALQMAQGLYDQDYGRFMDQTQYNTNAERDAWDRYAWGEDRTDAATAAQNDFTYQQARLEADMAAEQAKAMQGSPINAATYAEARKILQSSKPPGSTLSEAEVMNLARRLAGQQTGGQQAMPVNTGNGRFLGQVGGFLQQLGIGR